MSLVAEIENEKEKVGNPAYIKIENNKIYITTPDYAKYWPYAVGQLLAIDGNELKFIPERTPFSLQFKVEAIPTEEFPYLTMSLREKFMVI